VPERVRYDGHGSGISSLPRAVELARRVADDGAALHAGCAHVDALAKLFCIVRLVSLGDARSFLVCALDFLRARSKVESECRENAEAPKLHGLSL
jgi:hypothetical protein